MREYVVLSLSIALTITPAAAVHLGLSTNRSGVDVSGSATFARHGGPIDLGAQVRGAGEMETEASVRTHQAGASHGGNGGSAGVDPGVSVGIDKTSAGASKGTNSVGPSAGINGDLAGSRTTGIAEAGL